MRARLFKFPIHDKNADGYVDEEELEKTLDLNTNSKGFVEIFDNRKKNNKFFLYLI